jgi:hypothetical protein
VGTEIGPLEELRLLPSMTWNVVEDDGPTRLELGVATGPVMGLSATAPIILTPDGSGGFIASINAATTSLPGSLSAADKAKLDAIGAAIYTYNPGSGGGASVTPIGAHGVRIDVNFSIDTAVHAPTGFADGSTLEMRIIQVSPPSFSWIATWDAAYVFPPGISSTLGGVNNGEADLLVFKQFPTPTPHWLCINHVYYVMPP